MILKRIMFDCKSNLGYIRVDRFINFYLVSICFLFHFCFSMKSNELVKQKLHLLGS